MGMFGLYTIYLHSNSRHQGAGNTMMVELLLSLSLLQLTYQRMASVERFGLPFESMKIDHPVRSPPIDSLDRVREYLVSAEAEAQVKSVYSANQV